MNFFDITKFGAVPDADYVQTQAIQAAVDAADAANGTVYVPGGTFKTGTINLKNASLYIDKGALLLGSPDRQDYYANGYLHCEFGETYSLLYSIGGKGITIGGEGTIDCNGRSFFDFDTVNLPEETADRFDDAQKLEATVIPEWRPNQPVFFHNCCQITVKDITILDAPCWTLTFSECDRVRVDGITNIGHPRIPNNDGIHVSATTNVIVSNCNITSADDCIAVSAITNWTKPSENITITNCILKSFSKAIVLGYSHSIVRNVTISNCQIMESNRAFCIMPAPGTGLVEYVTVSNMRLDTRVRAGNWWGNGEPIFVYSLPHTTLDHVDHSQELAKRNFTVSVRHVYFQNIICTAENAAGVVGIDNMQDVAFDHVYIGLKESDNLYIKGRKFDTSPSKVEIPVPECPEKPCVFYIQGAEVDLQHVSGSGIHGESGQVICRA